LRARAAAPCVCVHFPMNILFTLAIATLAILSAALALDASPPIVQLDAWGSDSVRIRVAPPGGAIVDPPYTPLLIPHPSFSAAAPPPPSRFSITSGNLRVDADAAGALTATRVSDGAALFTAAPPSFGGAAPGSRPGSVSAALTLRVVGGNKLFGLGEHRTGSLDMTNYTKSLEDSQFYKDSHGADILIPFYMSWPLALGVLWALPSYGNVSLLPGAHTWSSAATRNVDFWVTTTPAVAAAAGTDPAAAGPLAALLSNYVDAVGHAAPMPSYVAGFWACKNRYRNQSQVLDVARGYRSRGLPLDIITVDYMHWVNL
jgi:alpha-D-xyloside xylohydrolase